MKNIKCRLLSIHCYRSSEQDGDEAYLKLNGSKIWPLQSKWVRLNSNCDSSINLLVPPAQITSQITLDLYDFDTLFDDKIGSFILELGTTGGPFTTDMISKHSQARYSLRWEAYK